MSFGKRVDGFEGRRAEVRPDVMVPATITTVSWSKTVIVKDVCTTGARLQGAEFPPCGTEMLLKIEGLEVLATVLWLGEGECGVEFEEPISSESIEQLQNERRWALPSTLTPDERIAIAHWAVAKPRR